jgi:hypothetical protein
MAGGSWCGFLRTTAPFRTAPAPASASAAPTSAGDDLPLLADSIGVGRSISPVLFVFLDHQYPLMQHRRAHEINITESNRPAVGFR